MHLFFAFIIPIQGFGSGTPPIARGPCPDIYNFLQLTIWYEHRHSSLYPGILKKTFPHSREIHSLDPQPHRHGMLAPKPSAPRVTRCRLGKYWSRYFFFRKRLRVVDRELAIQSLISFRCLYRGQIGCQGDEVSRQPAVGGSEI